MKRLAMILALVLALPALADQPLTVLMGTGNPSKGVEPSIYASGKVEVRIPTLDELGQSLSYGGVGSDNFAFRARQRAQCRGDYVHGDGSYGNPYATAFKPYEWTANVIDVSGVREYREVSSSSVVGSNFDTVGLNSATCDNRNGGTPLTCATNLSRTVTNSLTRTSTSSLAYQASQAVNYRVGSSASPAGLGGETRFTWTGTYGESTGTTTSETIGTANSATTTVEPGGYEKLTLNVQKGTATFEINYSADFEGPVVVTCPGTGAQVRTTVEELYSGGIPHMPNGRCPWCSSYVPTFKHALTENVNVTQFTDASVTQESGD